MPKNPTLAIDAHLLSKHFSTPAGTVSLFENLNLQVAAGDSLAIIGQSGVGKSTLLSLLAGLDTPSSGSVKLLDTDLQTLNDDAASAWRAANLGFIFQSFHLLPELTALENVQLALDIRGDKTAASKAQQLLEQVGLGNRGHHYPAELSGGEQQRVAIARAFVTRPNILFADEPTGNLDAETGEAIIQMLFDLNASHHTTLVLITHDPALASRCQHQYRLSQGQLSPQEQAT